MRLIAASPKAPGARPGIVFGILTAAFQSTPLLPNGSSIKSPEVESPTHLNARTWITLPPKSVSNAIKTSSCVLFGRAGHAGFGSVD